MQPTAGPGGPDRVARAASPSTAAPRDPASGGRNPEAPGAGRRRDRRSRAILGPRFSGPEPDRPENAQNWPLTALGPSDDQRGAGVGADRRAWVGKPGPVGPIRPTTSHRSTATPSHPALQPASTVPPRPDRIHARSRSPPHLQGPRHSPCRVRRHPGVLAGRPLDSLPRPGRHAARLNGTGAGMPGPPGRDRPPGDDLPTASPASAAASITRASLGGCARAGGGKFGRDGTGRFQRFRVTVVGSTPPHTGAAEGVPCCETGTYLRGPHGLDSVSRCHRPSRPDCAGVRERRSGPPCKRTGICGHESGPLVPPGGSRWGSRRGVQPCMFNANTAAGRCMAAASRFRHS